MNFMLVPELQRSQQQYSQTLTNSFFFGISSIYLFIAVEAPQSSHLPGLRLASGHLGEPFS